MKSLSETHMGRALGLLADAVIRHRRLFLWPQFLLAGLCVVYTFFHLEFDTNRDNLVGSDKSYHQVYLKFRQEFPAQDDLVVVVESENTEKNRQFVERLGKKLSVETNIFTDVFYKGDLSMMGRKALLFVPENELRDMRSTLTNYLPFIQQFTQATNLDTLFALVNSQIYHAKREANAENDSLLKAIPMLSRIVNQANASLQRPGTPPSPGITALFGASDEAQQDMYITYSEGRIYLVTARARTDEMNGPAVERLRALMVQTAHEVPGVNVGLTGEPVIEHDEMQQSQKDATVASVVSLVICALIFIYGYQETGRPLKATVSLLVGVAYTLAFATLTIGHLNILTITFVPILIGLAIDFGVHLITRYEEELRLGKSEEEAMRKAMVFTGQGIFTGAMTTAAAFLAMALTNFKGIQEMGIICGGGMIVCFIPMMTLLPVMLFRGRQNAMDHPLLNPKAATNAREMRTRIENIWLSRPRSVTVITLVLAALAFTQFHRVYFDYNLLNMQSAGLPAVVFEKKLLRTPQQVLFAAVVADTPEQALELEAKLRKLPSVGTNISMAPYLTGDVTEKLKLIGEIKQEVAPVHFQPADPNPVNILGLDRTLYSTAGYMGAAADEVLRETTATNASPPSMAISNELRGITMRNNDVPATAPPPNSVANNDPPASTNENQKAEIPLADQLLLLRTNINQLRRQMLNMDQTLAAQKLAAFQQALFNDVNETFQSIHDQDNSSRLHIEDLPPALRNRFIGVSGKYLIQVYPKKGMDIWAHDNQEKFVSEVRSVDPKVTGTPVQLLEYTTLLKNSYVQAAYYALAAITIMVLIHFRSLAFLVLALLPVGIGTVWMGGLMGLFHIPFNPANIMTLPLVIGIGVTNGIHILNRFVEERNASILSKSTGKAVFVSGLTAIAGFGSLILAKHQGIRSLGEVMSMGVALCMIAALAFLPAVLNLWGARLGATKEQPSDDNARSPLGREEPR
ncbi:MAG: putative exporter of the superfamily [Pedosphaera sp.]|nr:putative exporter of the superfamily [Pedosphaera sp.]